MTEMILLGAGASAEADVPTSYAMSREMYPRFQELILPGMRNDYARAFAFIIGGLRFQQSVNWGDPYADVDVETLLSAVSALSDNARYTSEVAQFIQTWHPLISEFDNVPRLKGEAGIFDQVAAIMRQMLVDIVWVEETAKVAYLMPLLSLLRRQIRLVIATLNYDNTVELLTQTHGVVCDTGIERWSETRTFDFAEDGLHLLKLHGSVDWELIYESSTATKPMMVTGLRTLSGQDMRQRKAIRHDENFFARRKGLYEPAVIFGERNKLTAEGPFLDLLHAFKRELAASDRLTVIGYSFRDEHINTCIAHWLHTDARHRLRIITRNFNENQTEFALKLREEAAGCIEVISAKASAGLEQVFGVYEDANAHA